MIDIFYLVKNDDYQTLKNSIHNFDVNELNQYGENALFYVKSYEMAKLLLDNGINISQVDDYRKNVLFYIKSCKVAKLLIDNGININQVDNYGHNTLFYTKSYKIAKLLIDNGINVNQINCRGRNALWYIKSHDIAKLLIDNGININQIDEDGENALFTANYDRIKILLDAGIDINQIDISGRHASHYMGQKSLELIMEGIDLNLCLSTYTIRNKWKIIPVFDKSLLNHPQLQKHKDKLLIIDDPICNKPNTRNGMISFYQKEIYRKLRKYFKVNTDEEVDLMIEEL